MLGARRHVSSDAAVQKTNDDAQACKASCVKCGYFQDEFLQFFTRRSAERRAPLINRGYHARMIGLRTLLQHFLDMPHQPKQIISLGAGFDTTYFHLQASHQQVEKYVELDFVEVTRKKARIIAQQPVLNSLIPGLSDSACNKDTGQILTKSYALLPCDLRDTASVLSLLEEADLDFQVPTLLIAECVLVYTPADSSQALISQLGQRLSCAAFAIYEQILPYDPFGQQMMSNIEARGCPLLGIHGTPDLKSQERRFTEHGWETAWALDMRDIYTTLVSPTERRRVERLELFDEFEEWHLIQEHYCIVVGSKDPQKLLPKGITERPHGARKAKAVS